MTGSAPTPPLYLPQDPVNIATPFEGDLFNRRTIAERLTALMMRMPHGGVFAVQAPYGQGKSWFAKHWTAQLRADGFKVAYVDAFATDYVDDPFVLLSGEIVELLKHSTDDAGVKELVQSAGQAARAMLPIATRVLLNAGSRFVLGSVDAGDELVDAIKDAKVGDAAEAAIKRRIEEHEQDKKRVEWFRRTLEQVARTSDKPLVIMVDELDRCKPTFALQLIESVKHLFDVPNVIFVLFVNRGQLNQAVQAAYGTHDGEGYLRKFLHFTVALPNVGGERDAARSHRRIFCEATLDKYGFARSDAREAFVDALAIAFEFFALSLRDVERAVVLYSAAQPTGASSPLLAWLIALKLAKPDIFARILRGDRFAHMEAQELAEKIAARQHWAFPHFAVLHDILAHPDERKEISQDSKHWFSMLGGAHGLDRLVLGAAKKLDLSVE